MGFKDLFIVSENQEGESKEVVKQPIKEVKKTPSISNGFPTSESEPETNSSLFNSFGFGKQEPVQVPSANYSATKILSEHLSSAIQLYQNGFDSLNQAGYDFYEYYQAIVSAGIDNQQMYQMAFAMGNAMDKSITKEKLVQQADYYLSEINKVYGEYVSKGGQKKNELVEQKNHENQSLIDELNSMQEQLEALKTQITDRQSKLSAIDSKYGPKITEVDSKLAANSSAKDKISKSIEQVKQGITNYIK